MIAELEPLWDDASLIAALQAQLIGPSPGPIKGVSIDSRTVERGDLFVAIVGPNNDGHRHVDMAFARGAAAALVHRLPASIGGGPLLLVDDTLRGLERLGIAARARAQAKIVAVTGSVGKTSTKEMLALALGDQAETHASPASFNNHWGVPLSLARLPANAAFAIFEIGMNHAGEITPLTKMVRPHAAVITAIEAVHLEFFSGLEGIADAKAEIFQGVVAGGCAILNRDNDWFDHLVARAGAAGIAEIVSFGADPQADFRLVACQTDDSGSDVEITLLGQPLAYRVGQPGRHLAFNSLAVLAAAQALGADPERAAAGLERFQGVAGRGKRLKLALPGGEALLIDESYNASPASVRAALAMLGDAPVAPGGRRIAVLGDMRELGPAGPELHRSLLNAVEAARLDLLYTCGPLMRELDRAAAPSMTTHWEASARELVPHVVAQLRVNDIIMIKGSLGSQMADLVKPLLAGDYSSRPTTL